MNTPRIPGVSRRSALTAGVVGASTLALAACSKAASPDTVAAGTTAPTSSAASSAAATSSAASSSAAAPAANAVAKLSAITVGSAISATGADGAKIIVSRPTATTVAAFSAICTHQGCTVAPAGKDLNCPCHGSIFNATTGAVVTGPASRALPAVAVKISGDSVVLG